MSQLLRCGGCDTGYDVSRREPGKKVRCPRCKTVLVVPPPSEDEESQVTASGRLRRARGPACSKHPKQVARVRCAVCRQPMCEQCEGPNPVEHVCLACVGRRNLGGALKIDFGLWATYRVAARAFFPNLFRIMLWGLLAFTVAFVLTLIPLVIGYRVYAANQQAWYGMLGGGLAVGALLALYLMNNFLLLPAGCAVLMDDALRERELTRKEAFVLAARRVVPKLGELFLIFVVYLLLGLLVIFPGLLIAYVLGTSVSQQAAAVFLVIEMGAGLLAIATALGLAVPVCILEERKAFDSLGRAWTLSQQHLLPVAGILLLYFFVSTLIVLPFSANDWWLEAFMLSRVVDLFWPALLVTIYHGLAAEHAGVLGREG